MYEKKGASIKKKSNVAAKRACIFALAKRTLQRICNSFSTVHVIPVSFFLVSIVYEKNAIN